ncbi:MAG: stage II sporulation protein M [Candidatus Woesearchaeota archaeon]|nr:stage II sporulation protein M [Candidatus Woesearchaeota archaeon]
MVLESIISPLKAEKKPWDLFFIGLLYSSVAMFLALWIFRDQASLVMVFLTVTATVPLMYNTLKFEEEKDLAIPKERALIKEHGKALSFFMFLFLGFLLAFTVWYVFLPEKIIEQTFNIQLQTIKTINSNILGFSINSASNVLLQIFSNNVKVFLFCVFFSFFYGAGAIFILTWNASVISAAVGTFIRNNLSMYANAVGLTKVAGYFGVFSLGLLRYSIHGVPEILAYFIGGLAGGIISVAVIRHDFGSGHFKKILFDSLDLIVLGIFVLFIAALLEVFMTPLFF